MKRKEKRIAFVSYYLANELHIQQKGRQAIAFTSNLEKSKGACYARGVKFRDDKGQLI